MSTYSFEHDHIRSLAHRLHRVFGDSPDPNLFGNLCETLQASSVQVEARGPGSDGVSRLRACVTSEGSGRRYLEEYKFDRTSSQISLKITRYVQESEMTYTGGKWSYREDLSMGGSGYSYKLS